jgi:hypothetical protein
MLPNNWGLEQVPLGRLCLVHFHGRGTRPKMNPLFRTEFKSPHLQAQFSILNSQFFKSDRRET